MTKKEQFLELEKLINEKIKSESSSFAEQNFILKELINKKDEIHDKYFMENRELKNEIGNLKEEINKSIYESKLVRERCDKSIARYSIMYLLIIGFGLLSLLLYGFIN